MEVCLCRIWPGTIQVSQSRVNDDDDDDDDELMLMRAMMTVFKFTLLPTFNVPIVSIRQ